MQAIMLDCDCPVSAVTSSCYITTRAIITARNVLLGIIKCKTLHFICETLQYITIADILKQRCLGVLEALLLQM